MEIILYDKKFEVSEQNICEGRAKFLVREKTKDIYNTVKQKFLQYHSIDEMSQKIPKIAGYLMMNTTKNLVYILRREGVHTNAKKFLDSVFKKYQSVCYKVSKIILQDYKSLGLKNKNDISGAAEVFANAVVIDLNNLWYGYFFAHGFGRCKEFYTLQKFLDTEESLKKITFYTEKNLVRETYLNALKNIPYDMEIYNQSKVLLGEDKNIEKYKNLFTQDFKKNSYKNLDKPKLTAKIYTEMLKEKEKIYNKLLEDLIKKYKHKFTANVYFFDSDKKSQEKFKKATSAYAKLSVDEKSIVCHDSTFFGSADEGFVLTTKGIWVNNSSIKSKFFSWEDISDINYFEEYHMFLINSKDICIIEPNEFEMIKEIRDKMIQYI